MNVLNLPLIAQLRRNHALEHATIHVLMEKHRPLKIVGRSTFGGYYLYGDLKTEVAAAAAHEALARLLAGEHRLAIHPHCGTNLVTSGSLAGLAAFVALGSSKRRRVEKLPNALLAATVALVFAQPIGPLMQARITTMADLGRLTIKNVQCKEQHNLVVHFIETSQSS